LKKLGESPLDRLRSVWYDNIKMVLTETGWKSMDWTELGQDKAQWSAVMNTVMNIKGA
jgi:hypothetical protein